MVLSNGKGTLNILETRWLERLSDFSAFEMGVRVSCIAMKKDNPVLPGMKKPHAVKDRRDATLIQSVSIEPPKETVYLLRATITTILSCRKLWSGLKLVSNPLQPTWKKAAANCRDRTDHSWEGRFWWGRFGV